jgi:hypothetical protein
MLVKVENENFGYSVSTHEDWVIVGNPSSFRYDPSSSSYWRTGSVDIFKYNTLTDRHDYLLTIHQPINPEFLILASDPSADEIHTDIVFDAWIPVITNSVIKDINFFYIHWYRWILSDFQIQIDANSYVSTFEDDYGHSLDVYNNVLAVGSRWYNQLISIPPKQIF